MTSTIGYSPVIYRWEILIPSQIYNDKPSKKVTKLVLKVVLELFCNILSGRLYWKDLQYGWRQQNMSDLENLQTKSRFHNAHTCSKTGA